MDMAVAAHMVKWSDPLMASGYAEAVSRLLQCDFVVDDALLDATEVCRAVFKGVVGPLLKALENVNEAGQVVRRSYQHCYFTGGWLA